MDYCLPEGYQSRLEPEYFVDGDYAEAWQPDVYPDAAALARRLGARRIVALGCGAGEELAVLHPSFDVVGIDTADNIARCRERHEFGTWLERDLGNDGLEDVAEGSVLVCKSLIERLGRPERLLALLADALDKGAAAVVLSTPDRELTSTSEDLGPPENPARVREWTGAELSRFMASVGLTGHAGLTRSTDLPPCMTSVFAVVPGRAREQHDVVESWWSERTSWQRLVHEQDRTILRQQSWIGQLRTERDWLAQQREAWEATALEKEGQLVALASTVHEGGAFERGSLRWALRVVLPVAHMVRRIVPRRP